jgi:ABC-type nitrate/sulfonate/bicarbonate transport system ATPase subunit
VAIARAIAGDPKLVLADEPTGNLDSLMARQVLDLLEKINEMGTTIIMVTTIRNSRAARTATCRWSTARSPISSRTSRTPPPLPTRRRAPRARRREPEMFAYYLRLALASFRRNPGSRR